MSWESFGKAVKSATGVSLAALLIIFASNGKQAIEALMSLPLLINAFAQGLPFGFWSGVLGTAIAAGFHFFARSWHSRSFGIELATILVGVATVMAQQWSGTRAQVLSAMLVGMVAGFGGLFSSKAIRALTKRNKNAKCNQALPESD